MKGQGRIRDSDTGLNRVIMTLTPFNKTDLNENQFRCKQ